MKVWDLHCDTLAELRYAIRGGQPKDFARCDLMVDMDRLTRGDYLLQCFACFVNLGEEPLNPLQACLEEIDIYEQLLAEFPRLMRVRTPEDIRALPGSGRIGAMLTVEEGGVCLDDPAVLRTLYRLGVRMMTLTWNHPNGLAHPNSVPGNADDVWPCAAVTDKGVTEQGAAFLAEMERLRMVVDVSHLSDAGFWDVVRHTTRPLAASHSNARALCGHVRNLTDEMIRAAGSLYSLSMSPSKITLSFKAKESSCLLPASAVRGSGDSRYVYTVNESATTFGKRKLSLSKMDVHVIAEADGTASIQEDLSYYSIAYMEDRALREGSNVMEYVE